MIVRPLRGRVVVRVVKETKTGMIYHPDLRDTVQRNSRDRTCHQGVVLAIGLPAQKYGHDVPHGFDVGDTVVFVYAHSDRLSEGHGWNGEPCVYLAQEEVQCVIY